MLHEAVGAIPPPQEESEVEKLFPELDRVANAANLLGYLNFSDGRPDPRWQKQLNDAYGFLADQGAAEPWQALYEWLRTRLAGLQETGAKLSLIHI